MFLIDSSGRKRIVLFTHRVSFIHLVPLSIFYFILFSVGSGPVHRFSSNSNGVLGRHLFKKEKKN